MVVAKIDELKSSLQTLKYPVVGLDIKFVKSPFGMLSIPKLSLICVGTRCLIIQLLNFDIFPRKLVQFLSDETICFLGTGISHIVNELNSHYFHHSLGITYVKGKTCVEVGYLAAKVLKKANIDKKGLAELAGEVGMDIKEPTGICSEWNAIVFSDEEIKFAIHNAYTSYVIGNKLCDMV